MKLKTTQMAKIKKKIEETRKAILPKAKDLLGGVTISSYKQKKIYLRATLAGICISNRGKVKARRMF